MALYKLVVPLSLALGAVTLPLLVSFFEAAACEVALLSPNSTETSHLRVILCSPAESM